MSLSTLFLPYPISSFCTTSYASSKVFYTTTFEVRRNYIDDVIQEYINLLINKNYQNISYELNLEKCRKFFVISVPSQDEQKTILDIFNFYAEYIQITMNNKIYYFKTIEESNNFINKINQYIKIKYEIQEKVKKEIGSETKEDELNKALKEAKRKTKQINSNYVITDTSGISSDNAIVQYAIKFVGNPYVYGGTSLTNGTDCSGFTQSIYAYFGISIPRTAPSQAEIGYNISFDNIQPGDLIFYSGNGGYSITHVAIYIGGSKIVHAGTSATGINICSVNIMTKVCARRIV